MSRKRSREAMVALWVEFRDGARGRGVDDETIKTVFRKLIGFSNFGFPKAHSSAFAVLAYQSAWLRQRYPAEFLASLMNAQPMGFYPPATLVRDAQRRGVRVLPPCIARSGAVCTIEDGAVRVGLGYVREVREDAAARLVAERMPRAPSATSPTWPPAPTCAASSSPSSCGRGPATSWGARGGRCSGSSACWRAQRGGRASARAPDPGRRGPDPARARPLRAHADRLRDHGPVDRLAPRGAGPPGPAARTLTAAQLRETPDGARVSAAGLVVARQRPATAGASSSCCSRTRPAW